MCILLYYLFLTKLLSFSDRHQLVQQMQQIGAGAHGPQAAAAIRHAAAQNGVWSLGNFGGIPPKSAMTFYDPTKAELSTSPPKQPQIVTSAPAPTVNPFNQTKQVDPTEYRFVFNSCGAGIAIASMGGAFIDCNQLFCQLSNYTKQEICSLTIFNLTARQDLQAAFDQISQLISPPMEESGNSKRERPKPVVFRGAMKNRDDLGLSVSLVKGDDGVSKCFCVTIVKNRESPFDTAKPIPVSFEAILPGSAISKEIKEINTSPAFTSG
jgi:PAS domain-containing protein